MRWRRGRAGLELFNAERAKHDPAQFYDMDYFDFIADPVRDVEGDLSAVRHRLHRRGPGRR